MTSSAIPQSIQEGSTEHNIVVTTVPGILPKVICPSESELQIERGCVCPVEGCCKQFMGSSQMQMHLLRHHQGLKLKEIPTAVSNCVFYCPVEGCSRGKENGKPFPRLGQLKQHYQAVHGKKDNICQKCGKGFALKDQCNRHEAECGQTFACGSCSDTFRTKNGLYMHVKRKKHNLPEGIKPRKTNNNSYLSNLKSQNQIALHHSPSHCTKFITALPTPIIVKQLVQLPRRVTTSTQTTQTNSSSTTLRDTASQTDSEPHCSELSTSSSVQTNFNLVCDFSHSNPNSESSLQQSAMTTSQLFDSVTTQTDHDHLSCIAADLLSLGTQTMDFTFTQGSQTPLAPSCEFGTQTATNEMPCPSTSSGIQCLHYDLNSLDLVDFGTQTIALNLANNQMNSNEVTDFGTQTIFLPDVPSLETALSSSVDHDDLHLLPPECMDFGTQTRECELSSIPSFDFGVQTALDLLSGSDTKDQGSQT